MIGRIHASFLHNADNGFLHSHAPTIAETSEGDLLTAWYAYPEEETKGAIIQLSIRRSGQSDWSRSTSVVADSAYSAGNPVLFEGARKRIWLLYVTLTGQYWDSSILQCRYSDDKGNTWSPPRLAFPEKGTMIRHAPVLLDDGSHLLPAHNESTRLCSLFRSNPPHLNWRKSHTFNDCPLIQPSLIRTKEKTLMLLFRPTGDPRNIWKSVSDDEGLTWSPLVRLPLPNPLSGIAAYACDGHITLIYNPSFTHRYPLALSSSPDSGASWSEPILIEKSPIEVSYPAFIVGRDRQVHGVYTFNRRMIKYVSFSLQ